MKAEDPMTKALQAAASAKVLLDTGDADGACNRAYYAIFDAARAALRLQGTMSARRTRAFSTLSVIVWSRMGLSPRKWGAS